VALFSLDQCDCIPVDVHVWRIACRYEIAHERSTLDRPNHHLSNLKFPATGTSTALSEIQKASHPRCTSKWEISSGIDMGHMQAGLTVFYLQQNSLRLRAGSRRPLKQKWTRF
jgi:hypothetical protein